MVSDEYVSFVNGIRRKEATFTDSISEQYDNLKKRAEDSKITVKDGYGNSLTSTGTHDITDKFTTNTFDNDSINYLLWLTLYNSSWVFKRVIDKVAIDEIKAGITLEGDEDFTEAYRILKKCRTDLIELRKWARLFGGAVACMMFDNLSDEDYSQPINYHQIHNSKIIRFYITDRWYGLMPSSETVTDMTSVDFGKPKFYTVTYPNGNQVKFHHSFVLRSEGRSAPKLIKSGMLQGWGYAEGSHILNELMRDEKLKSTITSLVDKSLIEIIKMAGMRGLFMSGDAESKNQLEKRLEMVNWARNFNSLTFLDKEDEYQQNQFGGLSGLSDLLDNNMVLIAAATEMQGILFGPTTKGFTTDESAMKRYDDVIVGNCETYDRCIFEKILKIIYAMCGIESKVEFSFNSLLEKEYTKEKMSSIKEFTDLLSKLQENGIITTSQYAKSIQTYAVKGIIDLGITDEYLETLKEKEFEEYEKL